MGERLSQPCDKGLGIWDVNGVAPSFYQIATAVDTLPIGGLGFAILNPPNPLSAREGQVETDLDGDGAQESLHVCNSTENIHFMIWTGAPGSGIPRWHGNYYAGYDMEPSCTDEDVAGMAALNRPETPAAQWYVTPPSSTDKSVSIGYALNGDLLDLQADVRSSLATSYPQEYSTLLRSNAVPPAWRDEKALRVKLRDAILKSRMVQEMRPALAMHCLVPADVEFEKTQVMLREGVPQFTSFAVLALMRVSPCTAAIAR